MTVVMLIYYLLTAPTDHLICALWVDVPPSHTDINQACGPVNLAKLELRAVLHESGETIREDIPAVELYDILEHLPADHDLGDYRLEIYEPDHVRLICTVETRADRPSPYEVRKQCGHDAQVLFKRGLATLEHAGQKTVHTGPVRHCQVPDLPTGTGLYHNPISPDSMGTSQPLTWLAGQLIWWGYAQADCGGGYSGIDIRTLTALPCGVDGAREHVTAWQNQFDPDIYQAAQETGVPARLLKGVIGVESQFWPLWNSGAETSVAQVTMDGLDIALRYDPQLAATYCLKSLWDCAVGYPRLSLADQETVRQALYADLACYRCGPEDARQATRRMIPLFARLLRAYRCYAVELSGETDPARSWQLAAAAYHAGGDCIRDGEICDRGIGYLNKITALMTELPDSQF